MDTKLLLPVIDFNDEDDIAVSYERAGADGVIMISRHFEDEDRLIKKIKYICSCSDCRLYICHPYRRLEDVKKILYAGAAGAWIDAGDTGLLGEAASRFGTDKIGAVVHSSDGAYEKASEAAAAGAGSVFIDGPSDVPAQGSSGEEDGKIIASCRITDRDEQKRLLSSGYVGGLALTGAEDEVFNINALKCDLKGPAYSLDLFESSMDFSEFKKDDKGLVPVITQDYRTGEVLMLAYMNREAYEQTVREGMMTYFSRSRQELWRKGDTSGHYQYVKSLDIDCDRDTILAKVEQIGAACHTGHRSCFYTNLASKPYDNRNPMTVFQDVMDQINDRKEHPKEGSYTNYLFDQGIDKILKKIGEESAEIIIAAKNPDTDEIKYEMSDFLYHMMVLMAQRGVTWQDLTGELAERH